MAHPSGSFPFKTPSAGSRAVPRCQFALLVLFLLIACSACNQKQAASGPPQPKSNSAAPVANEATLERIAAKHLPNAVRVHDKVISGGLPEGDEAFAELKSLGVKTVISVDGAKPDVATAEKYGLRYVHLPHGYDGVPEPRVEELAKAVRDLPGKIYIHCHHGKHRSPAASSVACVAAGLIGTSDAVEILKFAGTSEHYRGLYESARTAHPLDKALLDELQAEFPSTAKLPAMAEAMVELEHVHDHLKALEKADWKMLPSKPDLVPAHEALLLREHFTELLRTEEVRQQPERFQALMKEGESHALELEAALRAWSATETPAVREQVTSALQRVSENCKACHERFRDVPLSEKQQAGEKQRGASTKP